MDNIRGKYREDIPELLLPSRSHFEAFEES